MSGANYLSWYLEFELHLRGQGLVETFAMNGKVSDHDKANALIFIRCHLYESLKVKYLQVRDPLNLWTKLRKRYDHIKTLILP